MSECVTVADRHKTPGLSWHPPAELSAWVDREVTRRGGRRGDGTLSLVLNEALTAAQAVSGHAILAVICADAGHGIGGKVIARDVTVTEAIQARQDHYQATGHFTDCQIMLQEAWDHLLEMATTETAPRERG